MDAEKRSANLSNAALSSFLVTAGEASVLKVAKLVQLPFPATTPSQTAPSSICVQRTKTEEDEISVFGAERYFSMKLDEDSTRSIDSHASKHGLMKDYCVDLPNRKAKSRAAIPSLSSESSWNSQVALLPGFPRQPFQNTEKKVTRKMHFSGFICNRSCSVERSLNIHKHIEHGGIHGIGIRKRANQFDHNQFRQRFQVNDELHSPNFGRSNRGKYFSFPISSAGVQNSTAKLQLKVDKIKDEEPRISLEVFGSHIMNKSDIAMNLERKLSILTWDAIPKSKKLSITSGTEGVHEDMGSDASSDLFEIENLSGSENPMFTRQESDGMSSCMTSTTKYEPSETSIDWSVVTASAAGFLASTGFDERKLEESNNIHGLAKAKSIVDKEVPKSRPSGLLGCKSQKAVSIAETAYRANERTKSDSLWQKRSNSSV
ncbi:protein PHYTOCHROME KINASE SUBSTRATE 3-like [Carya illinoinensis]|uniref:Uncharacterized protein n=1 Tax=Carya illinoinensis TaxID=32201 RepID=A0A922DFH6_CARIL|nr:protein PHYTOCHROME KINASE SUBSTRATE 3-like [Carya illinoinensis]KAG6683431.1 hypothetical protein I3842_12G012700 [Carya illinoinensis]